MIPIRLPVPPPHLQVKLAAADQNHWALIAGGSDGIGEAFANYLAKEGYNLFLIARNQEKLDRVKANLQGNYKVEIVTLSVDMGREDAADTIMKACAGRSIRTLVTNAAYAPIDAFLSVPEQEHLQLINVNMRTPLSLIHRLGSRMKEVGPGRIIIMSSLAGFQGSSLITHYAASKAYLRILAEGLWAEFKNYGIEVITCCAGATATPSYLGSKPQNINKFAPPVLSAEQVVQECMSKLGKRPLLIPGKWNRLANFFMARIMSQKKATEIMSKNTEAMYGYKKSPD